LDSSDPENVVILDLDGLKAEMEEGDIVSNGMLDKLIRGGNITEEMATSLMNDSAYTYDISTKLIDMGEILFAARALEMRADERDIALSEDELDAIVKDVEAEENATAK
jgi:phosphate:Na+ symporter